MPDRNLSKSDSLSLKVCVDLGESKALVSSPLQNEIDCMIADSKQFHASVQSEKVFNQSDYLLFALLTVVTSAAVAYFMMRWFAYGDWYARPLPFWGLTLILIGRLTINQSRWWYLPFIRRPISMTPRPGWKVGDAGRDA